MEKYKVIKTLGDGMFGSVKKAIDKETNRMVAIKKMKKKYYKWDECVKLPEIQSLIKLAHPNIVKLFEVLKSNDELYFVFEYLDQNVYQLISERKTLLSEIQIRNILYQTLQALAYMHRHGYFHRDLKPENMLEYKGTIKIADFGLAKENKSRPPYTEYVSTRWYRAPEVILRAPKYGPPIDIFAVGAIMAELYKNAPLFPGSSETDQINKICVVLGTPVEKDWPEGYRLASQVGFKFPKHPPQSLRQLIPMASDDAIHLLEDMLNYNPEKRPTAADALQHPFFQCHIPIPQSVSIENLAKKFYNDVLKKEAEEEKEQAKNLQGFAPQVIDEVDQKRQESQPVVNNITRLHMKKARYRPGVDSVAVTQKSQQS